MALPSFFVRSVSRPPRFHPSWSFIRHSLYTDLVYTFLFFFFPLLFPSSSPFPFFLVPLALLIGDRAYLPLNISLFLPFRHNFYAFIASSPSRFDVPFTEPLWSSALFPFLFFPLSPSYNAWNDFLLCTPIHICTLRRAFPHFLTTVFRFRYDRNYILNFLLCLDNLHSTTRHSSLSHYSFVFDFLKATRKIIKIIRLLYRIVSFPVWNLFLKQFTSNFGDSTCMFYMHDEEIMSLALNHNLDRVSWKLFLLKKLIHVD